MEPTSKYLSISDVDDALDKAKMAYQKPLTGVPFSDLNDDVNNILLDFNNNRPLYFEVPDILDFTFGNPDNRKEPTFVYEVPYSEMGIPLYPEIVFKFSKPVPDNCFLQVVRYAPCSKHLTSTKSKRKGGQGRQGKGFKRRSVTDGSSTISILKGSVKYIMSARELEIRTEPPRSNNNHLRNRVLNWRPNTCYFKFALCTYTKCDYKPGLLSVQTLVIRKFMLTVGGHNPNTDDSKGFTYISLNIR